MQGISSGPYCSSHRMRPLTAQGSSRCLQPRLLLLPLPLSIATSAYGKIGAAIGQALWKDMTTPTTMILRIGRTHSSDTHCKRVSSCSACSPRPEPSHGCQPLSLKGNGHCCRLCQCSCTQRTRVWFRCRVLAARCNHNLLLNHEQG